MSNPVINSAGEPLDFGAITEIMYGITGAPDKIQCTTETYAKIMRITRPDYTDEQAAIDLPEAGTPLEREGWFEL